MLILILLRAVLTFFQIIDPTLVTHMVNVRSEAFDDGLSGLLAFLHCVRHCETVV